MGAMLEGPSADPVHLPVTGHDSEVAVVRLPSWYDSFSAEPKERARHQVVHVAS